MPSRQQSQLGNKKRRIKSRGHTWGRILGKRDRYFRLLGRAVKNIHRLSAAEHKNWVRKMGKV